MADRVLILGASARAAAASARRAGLDPFAVDLFADADTRRMCECRKCPPDEYPHGLFRLARQVPPMPWMYTGGLENDPELIAELSRERELWGNGPGVLAKVRDPSALAAVLTGGGFAYPRVVRSGAVPTTGRRWLRKPVRGSGGGGIRFATAEDRVRPDGAFYLQEYVTGRPMSAVYQSTATRCGLLGVTRQLIGEPWLHARPFQYAGNCAVVGLAGDDRNQLAMLGYRLMTRGGLRGTWGVDYVRADVPITAEVNPRYPASAEVIEWAARPTLPSPWVGKAIYYAPHRLTFPASGPWDDSLAHAADCSRRPDYADIPHPGDGIGPGQPVLTIFAEAGTEADCLGRLQSRAAELDRLFGYRTPSQDQP